ncbi:MAG: septum formation protein Maf [Verrucomicrobia bacterium]|nr:MAG: septum formation protein Maf [Verrucomicrobiota bacterium]
MPTNPAPVNKTPENPPEDVGAAPRLILASASPRRRELLASLGITFIVEPAEVEEHEPERADPQAMVRHNAALKADWVATRHPDSFVLGADTTVYLDGCVLHKPADLEEARRMLRRLSGRAHAVFTGLALRHERKGLREDLGVESKVVFKALDDAAIERYLAVASPLDKAGAYGIQDHGELIIERWEGSFTNIVGLPLEATRELLTRHGLLTH